LAEFFLFLPASLSHLPNMHPCACPISTISSAVNQNANSFTSLKAIRGAAVPNATSKKKKNATENNLHFPN